MRKILTLHLLLLLIPVLLQAGAGIAKTAEEIEELEKKLPAMAEQNRIAVLNKLAAAYQDNSPQKTVQYALQALKLARKYNNVNREAEALMNCSFGYRKTGSHQEALQYAEKAVKLFESLGDQRGVADCLKSTGVVYWLLNKYDMALEYFFRALKTAETAGYKTGMANILNNIGNVYFSLRNGEKAREYYLKSLEINKQLQDKHGVADAFNNLGLASHLLGKKQQALEYYLDALKMLQKIGNKDSLALAYLNIGTLYHDLKEYHKSLTYSLKSYKLAEETGSRRLLAKSAGNVGQGYLSVKVYGKVLPYLETSLRFARETGDNEVILDNYQALSRLFAIRGDYKTALDYHKQYAEVMLEVSKEKSSRQLAEMQTRLETFKKEKEIELLKKSTEILEKDNRLHRVTRNTFIAGFILLAVILGMLFKKYLYLFSFWKKQKYIGRYRLQDPIGSGGMGTVYKAHAVRDKTEVAAVKVLREELFTDETSRKRFKQEAAIIDKLDHPNIIKIFEKGEHRDRLYIAMEFLQGRSLAAEIQAEGALDLRECYFIMRQAAAALAAIHAQNIIHRDLKPSNIIILAERNKDMPFIKLLDFGLARTRSQTRLTQSGALMGTINYISPEQLSHSRCSPASDIYSLGVTFYEMLTGITAFQGDTATEIVVRILERMPEELLRVRPDVPGALNRLVMEMMSKDPGQRPSAEVVRRTIEGIT
ncbi:MAG: protein kinase [bacterium]|nr:protein kinase [bacterium]